MLRNRVLTALVTIPALIWFILWSPTWMFQLLVLTATFIALREFAAMGLDGIPYAATMTTVGGMAIALAMAQGQSGVLISAGLVVCLVGTLLLTLALAEDMHESVSRAAIILLGALYAGMLLPHFIWLRALSQGPALTFFVVAVAMAGDVGGYFGGRAFGRIKLWPTVSPNKTVEGAAVSLTCSILAGVIVNAVLLTRPLPGWEVVVVSAVAGMLAQCGDLLESMIKRAFDADDSGWILPGHGGVLDRTDSLVLPVVFVYYYAILGAA